MVIKLSILIATMPNRLNSFQSIIIELQRQLIETGFHKEVEIISDSCMEYNIGTKRNKLLYRAKGEYIVFIDDDDEVSNNYISLILEAINHKADCIGISGYMTTNNEDKRIWHISKEYQSWYEHDNIYYRTPNHISPVLRILALQVGFPEISYGEDFDYSMRLLPLLKTEIKIQEQLYYYKYEHK